MSASRHTAECVSTLFLLKRGAEVLTVFFWKPGEEAECVSK